MADAEEIEKMSDRIEATMMEMLTKNIKAIFLATGMELTDEQFIAFRDGENASQPAFQIAGLSCYVAAIKGELDREAERRAAWENDAKKKLVELCEFRNHALTTIPGLREGFVTVSPLEDPQ